MAVMPDHWIRDMALTQGMIDPFTEKLQRDGVISYGLSSYGYDARVAPEFKIFTKNNGYDVNCYNKDYGKEKRMNIRQKLTNLCTSNLKLLKTNH